MDAGFSGKAGANAAIKMQHPELSDPHRYRKIYQLLQD
jgi:hypothetical protein